jgi:hypothetical protein
MNLDARILKAKYVDVCAGPMTEEVLGREIMHYSRAYRGSPMVITIDKSKRESKPYCAIYVPMKSFKGGYVAHDDS